MSESSLPKDPTDLSNPFVSRKTKSNVLEIAKQALKNKLAADASSSRCTSEIIAMKLERRDESKAPSVVSSQESVNAKNAKRRKKKAENSTTSVGSSVLPEPKYDKVVNIVVDRISNESVFMDFSDIKNPVLTRYDSVFDYCVVESDSPIDNVIQDNLGYYVSCETKGRTMLAASAFVNRSLPQSFRDVGYMDTRSNLIFVPLYKELTHLFKAHREDTSIQTSHLQAIKNVVNAFKNKIKLPLTQEFIDEFSSICDYTEAYYRVGVKIANGSTKAQSNLQLPGIITKLTSLVVRTECVQVHTCVDLPLDKTPAPYEIKYGTQIITKQGVRLLTKNEWFGEPPVELKYNPIPADVISVGRATHQWCSLVRGVRYANSTWNQYWAMQRIFKARENEDNYQLNQLRLAIALLNAFPHMIGLMKTMGVSIIKIDRELHNTSLLDWDYCYSITTYPTLQTVPRYTYFEICDICAAYKPLTEFYYNWSIKMRNTIGETLLDITYNTMNVVKYNVYTYWQSLKMPLLVRTEWSELPSPKKLERQRMVQGTILETNVRDKVIISVKDEIAKSSGVEAKMPRLFTSYGVGCCLAPGLPDVAKKHMNGWYMFNVGSLPVCLIAYTLPKTTELELLFNELISATMRSDNYLCVAFYSDDSCYAGCINGVRFGYNVDISSCDSSNGVPIFYTVISMLNSIDSTMAPLLLEQCCQPLRFNVSEDSSKNFSIKPPGVFEGSGTVLTTVLNHSASVGIAICTAITLSSKIDRDQSVNIEQAIVDGGVLMGHKITVASIEVEGGLEPSKFQFLKYSPMLAQHKASGVVKYIPVRNMGCIVKGFGQLKEPMQARQINVTTSRFNVMTMSEKFDLFLSGVVKGYCNEPETPLLNALRSRFSCDVPRVSTEYILVETDGDYSQFVVQAGSLLGRYGLENFTDMTRILLDLQVGDVITDYALETFMVVDYDAAYSKYTVSDSSFV